MIHGDTGTAPARRRRSAPRRLGIDLSKLDDDTFDWIKQAFAEHPVLVFRDQHLGAGDIAAFGRRFGTPRIHSLVSYRHEEYPEVSWLRNVDADGNIDWYGVKRATDWHTDSTYEEVPPLLAMLHALEIPAQQGRHDVRRHARRLRRAAARR